MIIFKKENKELVGEKGIAKFRVGIFEYKGQRYFFVEVTKKTNKEVCKKKYFKTFEDLVEFVEFNYGLTNLKEVRGELI